MMSSKNINFIFTIILFCIIICNPLVLFLADDDIFDASFNKTLLLYNNFESFLSLHFENNEHHQSSRFRYSKHYDMQN